MNYPLQWLVKQLQNNGKGLLFFLDSVNHISTLVLNFCKEKQEVEECFLKLYTWLHHHGTYTPCGVLVPYPRNPVKETTDKRRLPET